jgi:hypothetical protein
MRGDRRRQDDHADWLYSTPFRDLEPIFGERTVAGELSWPAPFPAIPA